MQILPGKAEYREVCCLGGGSCSAVLSSHVGFVSKDTCVVNRKMLRSQASHSLLQTILVFKFSWNAIGTTCNQYSVLVKIARLRLDTYILQHEHFYNINISS